MRKRGKFEHDGNEIIAENKAAEKFYGDRWDVIREDFKRRVKEEVAAETFKW